MIRCIHNWPSLLAKYLAERMNAPFVWGKNDCCLFACDAVFEMTGFDLAIDFRGKYDSALSAVRAMKDFTAKVATGAKEIDSAHLVGAVADAIAKEHAIVEIPVLNAQRGDVALVLAARGESLGIVALDGRNVLSPGEKGLVPLPLKTALKAWRIPKA